MQPNKNKKISIYLHNSTIYSTVNPKLEPPKSRRTMWNFELLITKTPRALFWQIRNNFNMSNKK